MTQTTADDGCCHKTRLKGAPCPIGRICPYFDGPHVGREPTEAAKIVSNTEKRWKSPTTKMTPMEQAMNWERMSGERLSEAERKRIMDGSEFTPPHLQTTEPTETEAMSGSWSLADVGITPHVPGQQRAMISAPDIESGAHQLWALTKNDSADWLWKRVSDNRKAAYRDIVRSVLNAAGCLDNGEANVRHIAAPADLAESLAGLVRTFHARPDILALCGFHEHAQIKAACDALNKAGVQNV